MKITFLLSKEYLDLALHEVLYLFNIKKNQYKLADNLLIADINPSQKKLIKRLAYTLKVYKFLFKTTKSNLKQDIKSFNWNKEYKKDFCLRIHSQSRSEPKYANIIFKKLKNPKTKLRNPTTMFEIYPFKNNLIAGKLIHQNKENFNQRRPHQRPGFSPISLHPRFARCIINLTGIKQNNTFYDPLCGTAGLLIEAGLMNIKSFGTDISWYMIEKSKKNLKHLKIKNSTLKMKDALKVKRKFNYIATDLPYSKNTKNQDLLNFYQEFLIHLKSILKKRAVLIFPHFIDYKSLIKKANLKIKKEFSVVIHKSLIRKIVIIEK